MLESIFSNKKEETTNFICPTCTDKMHYINKNGILIDYCVKCKIFFIDKHKLKELIKNFKKDNPEIKLDSNISRKVSTDDSEVICSRCAYLMKKIEFMNKSFDVCFKCHNILIKEQEYNEIMCIFSKEGRII